MGFVTSEWVNKQVLKKFKNKLVLRFVPSSFVESFFGFNFGNCLENRRRKLRGLAKIKGPTVFKVYKYCKALCGEAYLAICKRGWYNNTKKSLWKCAHCEKALNIIEACNHMINAVPEIKLINKVWLQSCVEFKRIIPLRSIAATARAIDKVVELKVLLLRWASNKINNEVAFTAIEDNIQAENIFNDSENKVLGELFDLEPEENKLQ
jgi:hypothetical protein